MKRKRILVLMVMLAIMGSLAACGKSSDKPEGEHEPITINRFNNLVTEDFVDALHKVYPEINLQIVSYAGENGSGYARYSLEEDDITDIYVSTQNFHSELQPERLIDLSGYDFINNYSTFLLNSLDVDGSIFLLPTGYTVAGMYYNKTIMQENGWEVPGSFEELLALIPEIEKAGYKPFANAADLDGYPFNYFFSLGNTIYFGTQDGVDWKGKFPEGKASAAGNEKLQEVVRYYNEWVENGIISNEHMSIVNYQKSEDVVFYLCLGLFEYECKAESGKTYEFGMMPWLSRDGSNNMLTRNVSRYFGISKRLEETGNEQKLEDALHVLEFVSTEEGQRAIMSSTNIYMTPLNNGEIAKDSPYYEVADVINSGHSVQLVFVGWEDLITPIAEDIRKMIKGELPPDKLLEQFDTTYDEVINEDINHAYGELTEKLSYEKTAELCAIAEGKAVDADCAMVSLNEYHGDDNVNRSGVAWYLWKGKVNVEKVNMVRPSSDTISVLEMTGAEIKEMQAAGFDCNQNGKPYDYLLFTKGGMELEDASTYRMAISTNEVPEEMRERAEVSEASPKDAIKEYVMELGTFDAEDIAWKE